MQEEESAEYPPLSPHLTSLDFYLWGSLKDLVRRRKPPTLETSSAAIPVDTLATLARALVRRAQKCLQANGGHFECLL
jgi:hypothetical protein